MKRLLLLAFLSVSGLPVVAFHLPAHAGAGSANSCTDGAPWGVTEFPILTSPITLALQVKTSNATPTSQPQARLCYSTSPAGYTGPDTVGGSIDVLTSEGGLVQCRPETNPSGTSASCFADADPWYDESGAIEDRNQTYSFGIPVTFCFGSCTTASPGLAPTGVIIGRTEPVATGTDYNAGTSLQSLHLCINGACQSLLSSPVGAGVGASNTVTFPPLLCVGIGPCIPGGVHTDDERPTVVVKVGSTTIPVTTPERCVWVWNVVYPTLACP